MFTRFEKDRATNYEQAASFGSLNQANMIVIVIVIVMVMVMVREKESLKNEDGLFYKQKEVLRV